MDADEAELLREMGMECDGVQLGAAGGAADFLAAHPADAAGPGHGDPGVLVAADGADDEEAELVEDLALLPAMPRVHEQRSWQLCQYARSCKRAKLAEAETAKALEEKEKCVVHEEIALFGTALHDGRRKSSLTLSQKFACMVELVTRPARRVIGSVMKRQAMCAARIVLSVKALQHRCFLDLIHREPGPGALIGDAALMIAPVPSPPLHRLHTFSFQWDETLQRTKRWRVCPDDKKLSKQQVSKQVMVRRADMQKGCELVDGQREKSVEPFMLNSVLLAATKGSDLLAAVKKDLPLNFDDPFQFLTCCRAADETVVSIGCDRASNNDIVLRSMFASMWNATNGADNVAAHAEYCWAHGLCIAKSRCKAAKALGTQVNSLSRLMRDARFFEPFAAMVAANVRQRVVAVRAPRPAHFQWRAELLLNFVFAPDEDARYKDNAKVPREEKEWFVVLKKFLDVLDFEADGSRDDVPWRHFCWVAEATGGAEVGDPCCRNIEESRGKVCEAVLAYLFGNTWNVTDVARWTHVNHLLTRYLAGCVFTNVLPGSLSAMQVKWSCGLGLEDSLARLVAANAEDWTAKRKLRLLRVCRFLCPEEAIAKITIMTLFIKQMDIVIYAVLGKNRSNRASLLDLADTRRSPVCKTIDAITLMLQRFQVDEPLWFPLRATGAEEKFTDPEIRRWTRAQGLQFLAGLFDMCDRRLGRAPYVLVHCILDDTPVEIKRAVASKFFEENLQCQSYLCNVWRRRWEFPYVLLMHAGPSIRGVLERLVPAIDACERDHATMRQDLMSTGQAKSFTASSNRCFVRATAALHEARGGHAPKIDEIVAMPKKKDPHVPGLVLADDVASGDAPALPAEKKNKGNAFFRLMNMRTKTFKPLRAPERALTAEDRVTILEECHREWDALDAEGRAAYNEAAVPLPGPPPDAASHGDGPCHGKAFKSLWAAQNEGSPGMMLSDENLCGFCGSGYKLDPAKIYDDPDMIIPAVPGEVAEEDLCSWTFVHGCHNTKRGICVNPAHGAISVERLERHRQVRAYLTRCVEIQSRAELDAGYIAFWFVDASFKPILGPLEEGAPEGPRRELIVQLLDARWSPKVQYYAPFRFDGHQDDWFVEPKLPARGGLRVGCPRMDPLGLWQALDISTSDEVVKTLLDLNMDGEWVVKKVKWRLPHDTPNLLTMEIEGAVEIPIAPLKTKAKKKSTLR